MICMPYCIDRNPLIGHARILTAKKEKNESKKFKKNISVSNTKSYKKHNKNFFRGVKND